MADVHQPMAGAQRHVPQPVTYGTVTPAGLRGRTRPLHAPEIHAQVVVAATVPTGRTCTFSTLDILEWHGLGPAVSHKLLQHHGTPTTSVTEPPQK
jgi:hypothetical protein